MPRISPHRRGFTLIELLAVMAILALLMGILLPSLSRARDRAKQGVCLSRLKPLANATVIYLNENRDTFYPVRIEKINAEDPAPYANEYGAESPRWQWFIETEGGPVVDPRPFKLHKLIPFNDESLPNDFARKMTVEYFNCPLLTNESFERDIRDGAFGYNYQYLGNTLRVSLNDRWPNFPVATHQLKAPSSTILLADSRGAGRKHGEHSFTLDPPRLATERAAKKFGPEPQNLPSSENKEVYLYSPAEGRHNNRANAVFVDAHGEAMTLKDMGYDIKPEDDRPDVPRNVPKPLKDPTAATSDATNKLWTGTGTDPLAAPANAPPPGP